MDYDAKNTYDSSIIKLIEQSAVITFPVDGYYSVNNGPSQYRRAGDRLEITIKDSIIKTGNKCPHNKLIKKILFTSHYFICEDCKEEINNP